MQLTAYQSASLANHAQFFFAPALKERLLAKKDEISGARRNVMMHDFAVSDRGLSSFRMINV